MAKKSLIFLATVALSVMLVGCSTVGGRETFNPSLPQDKNNSNETSSEETQLASSSQNMQESDHEEPGEDSFIPVGKKVRIWYLQHNRYNEYQVGLRDTDKRLLWERVEPENVYISEDFEVSYIERIKDKEGTLGSKVPAFNI